MNRINPKEAPEGYVARKPKRFADTDKTCSLCTGCAFDGAAHPTSVHCYSGFRKDKRDVIFVKKT